MTTFRSVIVHTIFRDIRIIIGKRQYLSSHISNASAKRLQSVMAKADDTHVNFEIDFTPTVHLFFKKHTFKMYKTPALPGGDAGCFPMAHPRPKSICLQMPATGAMPTIPAAANRCSDSALTYFVLVTTALYDWTAEDHADFAALRAGVE